MCQRGGRVYTRRRLQTSQRKVSSAELWMVYLILSARMTGLGFLSPWTIALLNTALYIDHCLCTRSNKWGFGWFLQPQTVVAVTLWDKGVYCFYQLYHSCKIFFFFCSYCYLHKFYEKHISAFKMLRYLSVTVRPMTRNDNEGINRRWRRVVKETNKRTRRAITGYRVDAGKSHTAQ